MDTGPSGRSIIVCMLLLPVLLALTADARADDRLVIGEYFSHSECSDCHKANLRLADIYGTGEYDMAYVTLVVNKVGLADDRMDRYKPVDRSYPTVEFDGGYLEEEGLASRPEYESDIEYCEARDVPLIEMNLEMHPSGKGSIRVRVELRLGDDEDAIGVNVIAFVVEPSSRYRDHSDDNYGFGFLDMAIDADPRLEPGHWWTEEVVWVGSEHNDSQGDDFGDVIYDNLAVVCGVFMNESGNPRYSLQGDIADPPTLDLVDPPGDVSGQVELSVEVTGDPVQNRTITGVRYRVDGGNWTVIEREGDLHVAIWNSTDVDNGTHMIEFEVEDDTGTTAVESLLVNVSNTDFDPPLIKFVKPVGPTVNHTTEFIVNASDENDITVTLTIDDGEPIVLEGDVLYSGNINLTFLEEGPHVFKASVDDGTFKVSRRRELIVDNDPDPWFGTVLAAVEPSVYPIPPGGNASRNITFSVVCHDDDPVSAIEVEVSGITFAGDVVRTDSANGTVRSLLNSTVDTTVLDDGGNDFIIRIVDQAGQTAERVLGWTVDNTPPPPVDPDVDWVHGWHFEWSDSTDGDVVGYAVHVLDADERPILDGNHTFWTNTTEVTVTGFAAIRHFTVVAVDAAGNPSSTLPVDVGSRPSMSVEIVAEGQLDGDPTKTLTVTVTNHGDHMARNLTLRVWIAERTLFDEMIDDLGPRSNRTYVLERNLTGVDVINATVTFEGYDITSSTGVTVDTRPGDESDVVVPTVVVGSMVVIFAALLVLALRIVGFDRRTGWK